MHTYVLDLRVPHDESMHGHRGNPKEDTSENHGDDAGNPTQDAEGEFLSVIETLRTRRA